MHGIVLPVAEEEIGRGVSELHKVTQLISGRAKIQIQGLTFNNIPSITYNAWGLFMQISLFLSLASKSHSFIL